MKPFILKTIKFHNLFIPIIDIYYLSGKLISLHLLRRDLLAVYKYSFIGPSLLLQQSQLVDNPSAPHYILGVRPRRIHVEDSSESLDLQGRCRYSCACRLKNI